METHEWSSYAVTGLARMSWMKQYGGAFARRYPHGKAPLAFRDCGVKAG